MKLTMLSFLLCISSALANHANSQTTRVNIHVENSETKDIIRQIEAQTDYLFVYNLENVDLSHRMSLNAANTSVAEVLKVIFKNSDVVYAVEGNNILLMKNNMPIQQQNGKRITGKVTDARGDAIIGANVVEKGTTNGTITDIDGNFSLEIPKKNILIVSYIGYIPKEVSATGQNVLAVKLTEDSQALEEVVIVGYGSQKKANLTGAVASIDVSEAIGSRPITDVSKALQGISPGLTISSSQGGVGVESKIRVRGAKGSLNAESGTQPLILVDNVEVPNLNMINPEDIESISVLKDAASASIYGTRAAWGVILVTTKTGNKREKVSISYSNNFAWNTPTVIPEMASGYDNAVAILAAEKRKGNSTASVIGYNIDDEALIKMKEWNNKYGGQNLGNEMVLGRDFEERGGKFYFYRDFDAIDMFVKQWTPQQSHNVSINGGGDKTTFNVGMAYLTQSGAFKYNTDKYDRFNMSSNINTEIRDWWKVRANILYTRSNKENPYKYGPSDDADEWYYLLRWPRFYPYGTYEGLPFRSAVTEIQQAKQDQISSNYARISVGTVIEPMKGLTINADYTFGLLSDKEYKPGGEVWAYDFFNAQSPLIYKNYISPSHNRIFQNSKESITNTFKAYVTFDKNIAEKHQLKTMIGTDVESRERLGHTSERRNMINLDQPEIALATGDQYVTAFHNDYAAMGFFGRINYSYNQKYLLEVNARYDGSSRFPTNKKWGLFPSLSAGWRISEESYMRWAEPVLSSLKIRGSWGTIGNQDVAANAYLSVMGINSSSNWLLDNKQLPSVGKPSIISPALTWERITTLDLGLDARLFNDKLGMNFDWYQRTTSDMHSPGQTLPSTFGEKSPMINFGEMRATGFELSLDFNHTFENGFGLFIRGTLSDVVEKITKYNNTTNNINGNYEGKQLGEIWGYETDRLFQESDFVNGKLKEGIPDQSLYEKGFFVFGPGDVKFVDHNGDGKITYGSNSLEDHGDLKRIGNSLPRFEYGFSVGLNWKNFDFNTFFQGVGRRDLWANGSVFIPGWVSAEGWFDHQMDYWTPENTDAYYPAIAEHWRTNSEKNFMPQSRYILKMAYLRCKNMTLGYSLPDLLLKKITFQKARIYVSAENLFEIDNLKVPVDAESTMDKGESAFGKSYPFMRTISFGLQVSF